MTQLQGELNPGAKNVTFALGFYASLCLGIYTSNGL